MKFGIIGIIKERKALRLISIDRVVAHILESDVVGVYKNLLTTGPDPVGSKSVFN